MEFSKRLSNPESITELDIFNATAKELSILIGLQDVKTTCKYEVLALAKRRHHYLTEKPENLTVEDIQDLGLPEIKEFYDLSRDKPAGTMEQFLDRCKKHYENRALHVHVFDFDLIIKCFEYFNYEIIDTQFVKPYHQIVVGKKKI